MSEVKDAEPHITIGKFPQPTVRSYVFPPEVLLITKFVEFGRIPQKNKHGLTDNMYELGKRLVDIPGVIKVYFFARSEVRIIIGDAFSWEDIGPLVLGELIETFYPEVIGGTIYISTTVTIWNRNSHEKQILKDETDQHKSIVNNRAITVNRGSANYPLVVEVEYLFTEVGS